ncbi:class I SAM-dependent methyltransferase [Facilibium subflavum]|uniref:class I SAM-dependent methyltransferase n=1 Tax=Facilibium subflavum TaxID=2219058 RepID=UPI000E651948|nr:class I SAM-dependent methyltransferase [Facilibium subflavum]
MEIKDINDINSTALYDRISIDQMKDLAREIGLDKCPDLEVIKKSLQGRKHLIEVGCGYGRTFDWLINNTSVSLKGIEKSKQLYQIAVAKKGTRISIELGDFLKLPIENKTYDGALLLWIATTDYSKEELNLLIKQLKKGLCAGAIVYVDYLDTALGISPKNAILQGSDGLYQVKGLKGAKGYAYIPDFSVIQSAFEQSGFSHIDEKPYITSTNRKKIHLFELSV